MQDLSRDPRMAGMVAGDRNWSIAALLPLWLLYGFVFWAVMPYASDEVLWLLAVGGGLVLLFNTAAVIAMLAHLSSDRGEIYGLDLHYLDAAKANQL